MKKIKFCLFLVFCMSFLGALPLFAIDCPACGSKDLPSLVMLCPECGAGIYDYAYEKKGTDRSALIVKLYYTGDNPDKLSGYAKLFVNGKYMGNIEQTEKQRRSSEGLSGWSDGLGDRFTAYYEKEFRNIPLGQLRIEIEMRFNRLFGYGRSYKRVVFPYVMFDGKKKTVIEHSFSCATDFSVADKEKQKKLQKSSQEINSVIPEARVKTGTGTIKLDIGLFD